MNFTKLIAVACVAFATRQASAATTINFDELTPPLYFPDTTRLTDTYTYQGVTFQGPGGNDGLAVLQLGSFAVTGTSGPNILCGYSQAQLSDGGTPQGP